MATRSLKCVWRPSLASWGPFKNIKYLHTSKPILSSEFKQNSTEVKSPISSYSSGSPMNIATMEAGLTKYYRNRNPRSLELLGVAEKPKGFWTKARRVDFYHRSAS